LKAESDPPFAIVVAKLKTPAGLLLAAAWKVRVVPDGSAAFVHESVPHVGLAPGAGFASFVDETKLPEVAKPVFIVTLKTRSFEEVLLAAVQVLPLLLDVARLPPGYGFSRANVAPVTLDA
jgi:hypothetical protein